MCPSDRAAKIEITQEMEEAGLTVLEALTGAVSEDYLVKAVYSAMHQAALDAKVPAPLGHSRGPNDSGSSPDR